MIRPLIADDLPAAKVVIDEVELFPSAMLDGMTASQLAGEAEEEIWLVDDRDGVIGLLYCAPERMTSGTWNNLLLAVRPRAHGQGVGRGLIAHVEQLLRGRDGRVVLVETSGLPESARTRGFYAFAGYKEEARIREFYAAGEDKVIFRKLL